MQNRIYTISKLNDTQIFTLFEEIAESFETKQLTYKLGDIEVPAEKIDKIKKEINNEISRSVTEVHLLTNKAGFIIVYRRDLSGFDSNRNLNFNSRVPSPYFDQIQVGLDKSPQSQKNIAQPDQVIILDKLISKHTSIHIPESSEPSGNELINLLQVEVSDLSALHKKMIAYDIKRHTDLEEHYQEKVRELEQQEKDQKLEINKYYTKKEEEIEILKEELSVREKELDDRNHMHVRRELRQKISEQVKVRVEKSLLPNKMVRLNWFIVAFSLLIALTSGIFAYYSYHNLLLLLKPDVDPALTTNGIMVVSVIRVVITSLVTLGFLIYTLSWMRKTYLDNIKISNDLQRYALDINRASWAIETIMEMKNKETQAIPEKWIEGVCSGLFEDVTKDRSEISPLKAWAALLSVSGKVEVGPEGPRIELKNGQAKKIANEHV